MNNEKSKVKKAVYIVLSLLCKNFKGQMYFAIGMNKIFEWDTKF